MLGVDENLAPGKQIKASKKRKSVSFNTVTYYEYADEAAAAASGAGPSGSNAPSSSAEAPPPPPPAAAAAGPARPAAVADGSPARRGRPPAKKARAFDDLDDG